VPPADFGWVIRWQARDVERASTDIPFTVAM
jgi:hypothetical protein